MTMHVSNDALQEFIDGRLARVDRERVTAHLRDCEACRSAHDQWRRLDDALRTVPLEQVAPGFTRSVMEKLPLLRESPVAFRILEKFAYLFALFLVLGMVAAVFVVTGVVDPEKVVRETTAAGAILSGTASAIGAGIGTFSGMLAEYVPFAFGSGSVGITGAMVAVIVTLALLDRLVGRKVLAGSHRVNHS